MNRVKIDFAYDRGDPVTIVDLDMPGVVISMSVDAVGKSYRVIFWNDGDRYDMWLYEWEIEARE